MIIFHCSVVLMCLKLKRVIRVVSDGYVQGFSTVTSLVRNKRLCLVTCDVRFLIIRNVHSTRTGRNFSCAFYCFTLLLVHSAVVGTAPDYLKNMLYPVSERASQRALRSATNNDMVVPRSRLKYGERAFIIAAPRAWNSIPADLRVTLNTASFKKNLKTFLFRESYSSF